MPLRTSCILTALGLLLVSAPLSATLLSCPGVTAANPLGVPFGPVYQACGTATVTATGVTAEVPEGALAPSLEAWLGLTFVPTAIDGSGVLFPLVQIDSLSQLSFDWEVVLEPGAAGFLFAAADGSLPWVYPFLSVAGDTLSGSASLNLGAGVHALAFGVVSTYQAGGLPAVFDPQATFTNLSVTPVPEPSTVVLMAGGLGLFALLRRRR